MKAGERNAAMVPNQMKEKRAPTADAQTKTLIDLVKSLLNAMGEQQETHGALRGQ